MRRSIGALALLALVACLPVRGGTVEFDLTREKLMVVDARINDEGPFHLVLDSGADASQISRETAERAGLSPRGGARLSGATEQTRQVEQAEVRSIAVGDALVSGVTVIVAGHSGSGIDGILGGEFLRRFTARIDNARGTVAFTDPDHAADARRAMVHLTLDGRGPFTFLVDTGATNSAIGEPVAEKLAALPGRTAVLQGVDGAQTVHSSMVHRVEGAGLSLTDQPFFIQKLSAESLGTTSYDGILGQDVLRNYRVTLYFHAGTAHFERPAGQ